MAKQQEIRSMDCDRDSNHNLDFDGTFLESLPPSITRHTYYNEEQLFDTLEYEFARFEASSTEASSSFSMQAKIPSKPFSIRQTKKVLFPNFLFLIRMPLTPHGAATTVVHTMLTHSLIPMGLSLSLQGYPGVTVRGGSRGKQPDHGWAPKRRARGAFNSPSVVLEVAYSESDAKLKSDVRFWLNPNECRANLCLTLRIHKSRREIRIESWTTQNNRIHRSHVTYITKKGRHTNVSVTHHPFTIPFESLFCHRPSRPGEKDIEFSQIQLEEIADSIWQAQGWVGSGSARTSESSQRHCTRGCLTSLSMVDWEYLGREMRSADNTAQTELAKATRAIMARKLRDESPRGGSMLESHLAPPAIHPSFIQVANPYIFEQTVENCIEAMGVNPIRETSLRLQGVAWIDGVRRALNLPIRTFDTAVGYYHRFRLVHPDNEYNFTDAAAAALFTACKIEDTLKKSRDIVCAAYNLKLAPSEHLSADDPMFEASARGIIGLERLMLEASGFDFRTRHPQKTLMKLGRHYGLPQNSEVSNLAYRISSDLYRTFSPIKQNSSTMAFSCLELAGRLLDQRIEQVESGVDYAQWNTGRAEIMETLFDILELYTHHRSQTTVGSEFPADRFLTVRIPLNQEASEQHIPRYSPWIEQPQKQANGTDGTHQEAPRLAHPLTPVAANGDRQGTGERGRDAAVRFMLDPACADEERRQVATYFNVEMEEYEVEGVRKWSLNVRFPAPGVPNAANRSPTNILLVFLNQHHGMPEGAWYAMSWDDT
ncbi:Glutathione S-transferase/chloride channel C-terminal [Penicillium paradoxum]|uniref:Glutathione S-transferase/chloride channel C-terminal n=1 Tax=Penicillium paradoxum TaxID=176176 RepID=UPI002547138E|nr:Glutathione S-transferase/chloride channel C-terminal [Penicillium paradoxum]KAJ5794391.1 Glutathione S-transferase/chloride channel C-terminal [Penicillium paradoxum]